jgi:hypothetical protein
MKNTGQIAHKDLNQLQQSRCPISVCSLVIRWFRVFQAGQVEIGCNNVQTDETNFGFKMRFEI